jgi:MFS family permease
MMPLTRSPVVQRLRAHAAAFPRSYWLLMGGTFAYLVGYECGYPFESIYLNERLGISLTAIGLIYGLTQLAGLPMQVIGGAAADHFGRRGVLIVAISATIILFEGLAFARSVWLVVALIAFEAAFGWAFFQMANIAIISDLTSEPRRAEGFSISRMAASAGIIVGPLLGALLLRHDPTYRLPFVVGGAICGIFLVIAVVWLGESRPEIAAEHRGVRATFAGYREVLRDRRLLVFSAVTLLPLYCHGQFLMTFPVLLKGTVGVSASQVGLLISLYALSGTLVQYPLVRRLRDTQKMLLMAAGSALVGIGLGGAAFAPRGVFTAVFVVIISFGTALLVPISSTVISYLAPAHLRGRYMGVWTLVWTGGIALGPIFGGFAMDYLGGRGAYAIVLGVGVTGAGFYALLGVRGWVLPSGAANAR